MFSKQELLREVWGFRSLVHTRTVDSHASRQLNHNGNRAFVRTVHGVGYRLIDNAVG